VPEDQLQNWANWCRERIKPACIYMASQEVKHEVAIRLAKAASMWLPWRFIELNLLRAAVRERLQRFGLFTDEHVEQCLDEMEEYKAIATGVADTTDLLQFWQTHANKLPACPGRSSPLGWCSRAAQRLSAASPSSSFSLDDATCPRRPRS